MNRRNRGLKALGLSLIAMAGLMAFMAGSAGAQWLEAGKTIAVPLLVEVKTHGPHVIFLVPTFNNLQILCKKVVGTDVLLAANPGKTMSGSLLFSECLVFQNGVHSASCSPPNLTEPIHLSFKAKLIAHGVETYLLFEPLIAGGNLAQIKFKAPCALPETNNIKGTFVMESRKVSDLGLANWLNEEAVHVMTQAAAALFPTDGLAYGANAMFLDGFIAMQLTTGFLWSGHA